MLTTHAEDAATTTAASTAAPPLPSVPPAGLMQPPPIPPRALGQDAAKKTNIAKSNSMYSKDSGPLYPSRQLHGRMSLPATESRKHAATLTSQSSFGDLEGIDFNMPSATFANPPSQADSQRISTSTEDINSKPVYPDISHAFMGVAGRSTSPYLTSYPANSQMPVPVLPAANATNTGGLAMTQTGLNAGSLAGAQTSMNYQWGNQNASTTYPNQNTSTYPNTTAFPASSAPGAPPIGFIFPQLPQQQYLPNTQQQQYAGAYPSFGYNSGYQNHLSFSSQNNLGYPSQNNLGYPAQQNRSVSPFHAGQTTIYNNHHFFSELRICRAGQWRRRRGRRRVI